MPKKNRPKNIRQTLKRLFVYFKPFRIRFAFVILFVILSCGANVAGIYFLKPLINDYIAPYIGQKNPDLSNFINTILMMASIYGIGLFQLTYIIV